MDKKHSGRVRSPRRDGRSTRNQVLEAAGRVFAERGFGEATSKEICERAGTNSAAVNYYFGGKESLYEQVLVEAHRQMVSLEDLNEIMASALSAEEKLRFVLERMLSTAMSSSELWGIKVFLRELAAPSPFVHKVLGSTVLPKAELIRGLVREITGLQAGSSALQRATAFVVLPCVSLIMFPENLRSVVLPDVSGNGEALLEDLFAYCMGGLRALRAGNSA